MKRILGLVIVVVAAAVLAVPAQALEYKFRVYGAAAYVVPISDGQVDGTTVEAADVVGWELGAEWKPTNLLGIELAYLYANPDIEALGTTVGDVTLQPIFLSANFHLVRTKLLTFWVGPTASYANWGNLELSDGSSVQTDSEFAYGASTGVNISLFKLMALQVGARWQKLQVADSATGESVDVDPFFVNLGLAFRF